MSPIRAWLDRDVSYGEKYDKATRNRGNPVVDRLRSVSANTGSRLLDTPTRSHRDMDVPKGDASMEEGEERASARICCRRRLTSPRLQPAEKGLPQSSVGAQFGGLRRGIDLHPPAHLPPGRVLRDLAFHSLSLSFFPFSSLLFQQSLETYLRMRVYNIGDCLSSTLQGDHHRGRERGVDEIDME